MNNTPNSEVAQLQSQITNIKARSFDILSAAYTQRDEAANLASQYQAIIAKFSETLCIKGGAPHDVFLEIQRLKALESASKGSADATLD